MVETGDVRRWIGDAATLVWSWASNAFGGIEAWMERHETTSDLVTVWTLAVSLIVVGVVDVALWFLMRHMRDRTDAGYPLKRKKLSSGIAEIGFGALFLLTLWAYYQDYQFGPFLRYTIRGIVSIAYVVAAFWGVAFFVAILRERREAISRDAPDIIVPDGGH